MFSVRDGRVYSGSYDNNVYCLDANTGKQIWKFSTDGFVSAVGAGEGVVYFGSWDCNMYCLNAENGKLLWKFKTSMSSPSKIEPPETGITKTAEITWVPESKGEKEKYRSGNNVGQYDVNMSHYIRESEYTAGKRGKYK